MANNNNVKDIENKSQISGKSGNRRETSDLTEIMSERLMDPTIVERYGTSLKMTMGREYNKYLNEKYDKLKKEFKQIDRNSDDKLQFDELYDFFMTYENKTGVKISKEYIESLYDFIDQDKNHEISM